MKSITLCADDYGQNSAISQAIIILLNEKKLSATSCMTSTPEWLTYAAWLEPLKDQADIGIHFNLTHGVPLSSAFRARYGETFPSVSALIKKCYMRGLDRATVYTELNAQLDQFETGIGRLPDFIDGHQHIHQFPAIRDVILDIYRERLSSSGCYVRCVNDPKIFLRLYEKSYLKRLIIQLCGARRFKQLLLQNQIPHNVSFSGIYDFSNAANYAQIFPLFLQQSLENGLIMCHPGLSNSDDMADEIKGARPHEYRYFRSEDFDRACKENGISIGRGHFGAAYSF